MTIPNVTVEIAFTTTPNDPAPVWVDVSDYVEANSNVSISRGRSDEFETVQPSKLSVTLDNRDGRFTPEYTSGAYYPNVKKGRRIRVRCVYNSVTYDRFSGYIDEWPVRWPDGTSFASTVTVTASSRLARMGRGVELRSIIEEEYSLDAPAVYYTFGDAAGTTQAGNVSASAQPTCSAVAVGSGGGISFGSATGPGTDGMTAALFSPVNQTNGLYMRALFPQSVTPAGSTTLAYECFFLSSAAFDQDLVRLDSASGLGATSVLAIVSGKLRGAGNAANSGPSLYLLDSAASVNNGLTHHAMVTETLSGGNLTAVLYLDGVQVGTSTIAAASIDSRDRLSIGGSVGSGFGMFSGTLAHVAVTGGTTAITAARALAHANSGLTGFSGERSDQRIARLATYAGVPSSEVATETGLSTSIQNQLTNGLTPLALAGDVVTTESGVLFDARNGSLTFHSRGHRYSAPVVATFSATTGEVGADLTPKLDDQGLINDMTASRANGITVRATDTASVAEYGIYRQTKDLVTSVDVEVTDAANWAVYVGSTPSVRVPNTPIDAVNLSTAQAALALGLEIGDRIALSGLPAQAPASSMDFFVEGYTETIGSATYDLVYNLSPANRSSVWVLDSATYSVLGTTTRLAY